MFLAFAVALIVVDRPLDQKLHPENLRTECGVWLSKQRKAAGWERRRHPDTQREGEREPDWTKKHDTLGALTQIR